MCTYIQIIKNLNKLQEKIFLNLLNRKILIIEMIIQTSLNFILRARDI